MRLIELGMEDVPDDFLGIVAVALRARSGRRVVLVWEGEGAERFFERWVSAGVGHSDEVWIFHVTGWGLVSVPHAMARSGGGVRLFRVQRCLGWEPSDLILRADVYVVAGGSVSANEQAYPVSRIARVISGGGVLIGLSRDAAWVSAAERAGFVGAAGFAGGCGVWAQSFVGRVSQSGWGGVNGRRVAVIGAGLAGSAVADGLARRGVEVDVFDAKGVGREASGNRAAVMVPMVSIDDGLPARLSRWGCDRVRSELGGAGLGVACGVLQLSSNERIRRVCEAGLGGEGFRVVGRRDAAELCGVRGVEGGLWFPEGGWVNPAALCSERLSRHGGAVRFCTARVTGFETSDGCYFVHGEEGRRVGGEYVAVVLATAGVPEWLPWRGGWIGTKLAWGRNVTLEAESLSGLRAVVTGGGYCIPLGGGRVHLGATYEFEAVSAMNDDSAAGVIWQKSVGSFAGEAPRGAWEVRRSMRVLTADRLPMVGRLGELDGVFMACGLGSRGVVWSGVVAELIPALVLAEPPMVPRAWVDALSPNRFAEGKGKGGAT